jgi:hypothetical protein
MYSATSRIVVWAAIAALAGHSARAAVVTYNLDGSFASSKWNPDGSNQDRVPGGTISGYFSIDTDTLSVSELQISTTFYSLYNNQQVMGATYNYGVAGQTDDWLGTNPATNRQISGVPSLPVYVSLMTDLTGGTDFDGAGSLGNGSLIQIMDPVPAGVFGQRAYRPRLSLFMEGVDFRNSPPTSPEVWVTEQVWNVNIGNGIAGYSGAQSLTSTVATVPEPGTLAFACMAVAGLACRRRRIASR